MVDSSAYYSGMYSALMLAYHSDVLFSYGKYE